MANLKLNNVIAIEEKRGIATFEAGVLNFSDTPQALTAAGAVSITTTLTTIASAFTLSCTTQQYYGWMRPVPPLTTSSLAVGMTVTSGGGAPFPSGATITSIPNSETASGPTGASATGTFDLLFSGPIALTLANGTQGQIKIIVFITDGGNATLTPATMNDGTTLTFADAGDSAILMWIGASGWQVIGGWGPGTPGAGPTIG